MGIVVDLSVQFPLAKADGILIADGGTVSGRQRKSTDIHVREDHNGILQAL